MERTTDDESGLRHDLALCIDREIFPATRDQIVDSARRLHAPQTVIDRLERLPAGIYAWYSDVWDAMHPSEKKRWVS
jgi:hypothetical protein